MLLSKENLKNIQSTEIALPDPDSFEFPERIIQFGTGVLLRGLPDYYVDKANKQGIFKGRILVVKSTASYGTDEFQKQDSLYTLCIKGIEHGRELVEYRLINSISRVLSASENWMEILQAAENPDLEIVFSNTTEVGIILSNDHVMDQPPSSFPGKLLSFLYRRYTYFQGDISKGLVLLPTELISDNGDKLKKIIIHLAKQNNLESDFIDWLEYANDYCNTLVDRIVPGRLHRDEHLAVEEKLGYKDQLMIMAEPFSLWAIETDSERVQRKLSFAKVDSNIKLVPSINKFKEIKLRLLNGTHTLSCAIALWCHFDTVHQAMINKNFSQFINHLMLQEIGPSIENHSIEKKDTTDFSLRVVDRFTNPFLAHKWENIALNYTSKMSMRVIELIYYWYAKNPVVPEHFALGFAAYIYFMRTKKEGDQYIQDIDGKAILLQDEFAPLLYDYWLDESLVVGHVLSDTHLWGKNLTQLAGFQSAVEKYLHQIKSQGMLDTIASLNIASEA